MIGMRELDVHSKKMITMNFVLLGHTQKSRAATAIFAFFFSLSLPSMDKTWAKMRELNSCVSLKI